MNSNRKTRKANEIHQSPSTILALGNCDLNYTLNLSEEDAKIYNINDLNDLRPDSDISFLFQNEILWDKIQITTDNSLLNMLLYLNKICLDNNKSYIEFISFQKPILSDKQTELMFRTINDLNFLFFNKTYVFPERTKNFEIKIKLKDKNTTFSLSKKMEKENKIEPENTPGLLEETEKEFRKNSKNETTEKDPKKGGYLKKEGNIFNKINLDCHSYQYFICSIEDTLQLPNLEDFIELISYLKVNFGTNIIINYCDLSNRFKDINSMALLNKIYLLTDIFLFDCKDAISNFNRHYEIFCQKKKKAIDENMEINKKGEEYENNAKNENNENDEINENNDNNENSEGNSEEEKIKNQIKYNNEYENLNEEKRNMKINLAHKSKSHSNYRTNKKKEKENQGVNEKNFLNYFKKIIACNGALSILNTKIGFFLDNNFNKITIIEVPMNLGAKTFAYDIKPYPKLTHTNVDLIHKYKTILNGPFRDFLRAVFFGGILHKLLIMKKNPMGIEVIYPAYLTGYEILRRILSLKIKNIPFPEEEQFYIVKLDNKIITEYVKNQYLNKIEKKFVLDCTNLQKSKLKVYVPLFDCNLHEFFGSKIIQENLVNKGFINSKGFVNYDPEYRKGMGLPPKIKKNYSWLNIDEELYIKKQIDENVRNLKNRVISFISPTKIKLPIINCKVTKKINAYNINKQKKNNKSKCNSHCDYCDLVEKSKIEQAIEELNKRKMRLKKNDK